MLPDKRIGLSEKKKNRGNEEEIEESEHSDITGSHKEDDNFQEINPEIENDDEFIDFPSDYNQINTKDVKKKLLELMEEAKQNHTFLILQNQRLQELVHGHLKTNRTTKQDTEMNDYKYLRTLGNAYVVRKKLKETQDR